MQRPGLIELVTRVQMERRRSLAAALGRDEIGNLFPRLPARGSVAGRRRLSGRRQLGVWSPPRRNSPRCRVAINSLISPRFAFAGQQCAGRVSTRVKVKRAAAPMAIIAGSTRSATARMTIRNMTVGLVITGLRLNRGRAISLLASGATTADARRYGIAPATSRRPSSSGPPGAAGRGPARIWPIDSWRYRNFFNVTIRRGTSNLMAPGKLQDFSFILSIVDAGAPAKLFASR